MEGPAAIWYPVWKLHSLAPVLASSAKKLPSGSPLKIRSPAVESTEARIAGPMPPYHAVIAEGTRRRISTCPRSLCATATPSTTIAVFTEAMYAYRKSFTRLLT